MASAVKIKPNNLADEEVEELEVFKLGSYTTTTITVNSSIFSPSSSPPKPLFIVSPVEAGTYPVILFFPGTCLSNTSYSQLFQFICSHGFIIVSPQLYPLAPPCGNTEINSAAAVTNWLPTNLPSHLPNNITPNFNNLIISGHSRGGRTAFALPLGYATNPKTPLNQFSALVAIDPVAGNNSMTDLNPPILTNPTFNLSFPITVFGSGLGGETRIGMPCAPESANYEKFYERIKFPKARFVVKEYGHMDVLNDNPSSVASWVMSKCMCVNGKGPRDVMRRCVGGISVAFLKDLVDGKLNRGGDFMKIVNDPSLAPTLLDKVEFVEHE